MEREIIKDLISWKESKRRKPLLLTGVRQCGKTYILKEFGERYFDDFTYINFELSSNYSDIFEYDFDVKRIIQELEIAEGKTIVEGKTLLIFDEIQECPKAITSLKYFCENMQSLHIVAAGSLLGVALKSENISFPVGKVNRMTMYPMSFKEFLIACSDEKYINMLDTWPTDRKIADGLCAKLTNMINTYYYVGGMPEAVLEYVETQNLDSVAEIQQEILDGYEDDFSKHAPLHEIEKIRMIWESIPKQLAKENNKFVFSHVKKGKRANELEAALQWLKNAGLIKIVELAFDARTPLSANSDATYFKVYMSDIGLLARRIGLTPIQLFGDYDSLKIFKGAITENYVLNELIYTGKKVYFWRSGNSAEVDFIYEQNGCIIPVEVKAAVNTQAKSYRLFCKKYEIAKGFKVSMKNIGINECEGAETISLPLYMMWNIDNY